jgi:hypothetical protein
MYHKIGSVLSGWLDKMSLGGLEGKVESQQTYEARIAREDAEAAAAARMARFSTQDIQNAQADGYAAMQDIWARLGNFPILAAQAYDAAYQYHLKQLELQNFPNDPAQGGGVKQESDPTQGGGVKQESDPTIPNPDQTSQAYQDLLNQSKNMTDTGAKPAGITVIDNRNFFMKNIVWILGGVAALGAIIYIKRKRGK